VLIDVWWERLLHRNHRAFGARKTVVRRPVCRRAKSAHSAGRFPSCGRISISHTYAQSAAPVPAGPAWPSTSTSRSSSRKPPEQVPNRRFPEKYHYGSTYRSDYRWRYRPGRWPLPPVVQLFAGSWFRGAVRLASSVDNRTKFGRQGNRNAVEGGSNRFDPAGGRALVCNACKRLSPLPFGSHPEGLVHMCRRVKRGRAPLVQICVGPEREQVQGCELTPELRSVVHNAAAWSSLRSGRFDDQDRHREAGMRLFERRDAAGRVAGGLLYPCPNGSGGFYNRRVWPWC
jgi:hypothetical protein